MAFKHDNMKGTLFENDRKELDTHPDLKGSCTIEGKEYWVSAWHGQTRDGDPKLGIAFTAKEDRPQQSDPGRPGRGAF